MSSNKADTAVGDLQQEQMLKIITKGFYKELVNYGVHEKDIITISTHLLDLLIKDRLLSKNNNEYYDLLFTTNDIIDEWDVNNRIIIRDLSISPLEPGMCAQVAVWLRNPDIKYNFVSMFPDSENGLQQYFEHPNNSYFCIFYCNEPVGVIGADNIDSDSKKLEMKKFIGNTGLQGKGIGKLATFLFLYYAFLILEFNKVYIHTGDTNIRNINLNSKFGFELEGIFFDDVFMRDERRDVVRMGLLKSRWMEIFSAS